MSALLGLMLNLGAQAALMPHLWWPIRPLPEPQLVAVPIHGAPDGPRVPWYPERMGYSVKWGLITAGRASLAVDRLDYFKPPSPYGRSSRPRTAYRIEATAESKGLVSVIYKVDDVNRSWVDTQNLRSLAFSKKLREGSFRRDEWFYFFHDLARFVKTRRNRDGKLLTYQGVIRPGIHDVLSSIYYVRTRKLEIGRDIIVDVNSGGNFPLIVRVKGRETVKVPAGTFDCWKVEPELREEGIFIQKGKKMTIWLTADERKIPVLIEVEVFIGHIKIRLEDYRTAKAPGAPWGLSRR